MVALSEAFFPGWCIFIATERNCSLRNFYINEQQDKIFDEQQG